MNITENKKLITTTELARQLGLNKNDIVLNACKKCLPNKIIENGKTAYYTEEEATLIIRYIKDNNNRTDLTTYQTSLEGCKTSMSDELDFLILQKQQQEIQKKLDEYRDNRIKELELQNQKQQQKIEQDKPFVEFANAIAISSNSISIGDYAKIVFNEFGLGSNKLFKLLRDKGYLMLNNIPYQRYIDNNVFEIYEGTYNTPYGIKNYKKTLITGKIHR